MRVPHILPICAALLALGVQAGCYRSSNSEYGRDDTTRVATTVGDTTEAVLTDVEWTLVELNGSAAGKGAGERPANLTLATEDNRASGFAGCNRVTGTYTLKENELSFSPMVMTRMACTEGMDLEAKFAAALEATRSYRLSGKQLEFMAGDTVVARFTRE